MTVLPSVLIKLFANGARSLNLGSGVVPVTTVLTKVFIGGPLLGVALVNVNNTGLLGGTKRRTLTGGRRNGSKGTMSCNGAATRTVRCGSCPSRPLGPQVTGPILRNGYLITAVSQIPCAVRLPRRIIKTCRTKTLPLGALTGTILTGDSRVERVTRHGCNRRRIEGIEGRTVRGTRRQRIVRHSEWSGAWGGRAVGRGDPRRGGTTRHRISLVARTLSGTTSGGNI